MFKLLKKDFSTSQSRQHIQSLRGVLRSRLARFKQNRSVQDGQKLERKFSVVLQAWGISRSAHIPHAIANLRLRYLIFILPVFCTVIAAIIIQNFMAYLALVCVLLPCFLGVLSTAWRISVLENRRFVPFSRWIWSILPFNRRPK